MTKGGSMPASYYPHKGPSLLLTGQGGARFRRSGLIDGRGRLGNVFGPPAFQRTNIRPGRTDRAFILPGRLKAFARHVLYSTGCGTCGHCRSHRRHRVELSARLRRLVQVWLDARRQAQRPAAARSVNQMTSPTGRICAAGKSVSPDRILSRMSRFPSPETRNATTALESSAG